MLLESVAACKGFDLADFARRWQALFTTGYRGYVDKATSATLENLQRGLGPEKCGSTSADLGGAARMAPLVWWYRQDRDQLLEAVRVQTAMTHNNPAVLAGAAFIARTAWSVLAGAAPQAALEAALEDTGRVVVSLIQQFYTTPRMIRILGSAGDVAFVPFDGTHIRGDWDLRVGAGSTLPLSKSVQAQLALQLYGMQAIDQRALLEHVDFPDFEKILQRMGGPMPPEPRQGYPGWPGQPDPNRPNPSGYSLSIRSMPVPAMPPGPPGGMMPLQMPSVPPVGGGPIMHGGPTMQ